MSRLSDDELDEALAVAQSMNSLRLTAAVAELRERRALDVQRMATIDEIVRRHNEDLTAAAKLEFELRARVETFRNSMYALESRVTQLREQLAAALAAKDEACDLAESFRAAVDRAEAWDQVHGHGDNPDVNYKHRIAALRSIGKDIDDLRRRLGGE